MLARYNLSQPNSYEVDSSAPSLQRLASPWMVSIRRSSGDCRPYQGMPSGSVSFFEETQARAGIAPRYRSAQHPAGPRLASEVFSIRAVPTQPRSTPQEGAGPSNRASNPYLSGPQLPVPLPAAPPAPYRLAVNPRASMGLSALALGWPSHQGYAPSLDLS
jgi:hypothetical protein